MRLADKKCAPCEGSATPLNRAEAETLLRHLKGWSVSEDGTAISRSLAFKNYAEAIEFANKITPIAEREGHHPDLAIGWGKAVVTLSTHAIGGLSENDFILAAKIDEIAK